MSPQSLYEYADYAAGPISAAELRAAGYHGAVRYITAPALMNPKGHNQKHMTRAEYQDHQAAGFPDIFIFQNTTADSDSARAGGIANARLALSGLAYLGAPADSPVFLCNDRPTLPSPTSWQEYLRGGRSVLGRVGQYGFGNAIDAGLGIADWSWQCGAESALRPGVHMYQWNNGRRSVAGQLVDINRVFIPIVKDDDMNLTDRADFASPLKPTYSESHTVKEVLEAGYYYGTDAYNMLRGNIPSPALDAIRADIKAVTVTGGGSDPTAVAALVVEQLKRDLAPLFDLANRLEN